MGQGVRCVKQAEVPKLRNMCSRCVTPKFPYGGAQNLGDLLHVTHRVEPLYKASNAYPILCSSFTFQNNV